MVDIVPNFPLPGATSTQNILNQNSINITNFIFEIPSLVSYLPTNSSITGTVTARDVNGDTTIATPNGNIVVKTPYGLNVGEQIVFKLIVSGENPQLQLTEVNDLPLGENIKNGLVFHLSTSKNNNLASNIAETDTIIDNIVNFKIGSNFTVPLLSVNNEEISKIISESISSKLIESPEEIINIVKSSTSLEKDFKIKPSQIQISPGSSALFKLISFSTSSNSVNLNEINGLEDISNNIDEVNSSAQGTQKNNLILSKNTSPLQFNCRVIANNKNGEIILKTPIGLAILPPEVNLPKNSEINIQLLSLNATLESNELVPQTQQTILKQLVTNWHSLQNIIETIEINMPAEAEKLFQNFLPQTDTNLASKVSAFISAIRGGGATQWLGSEIIRSLKQSGKDKLLDNITHDFSVLKELLAKPINFHTWQNIFFPVYDGKELHQTRMFVRDYEPPENNTEKFKDTRFVIEIDTEIAGELQFDGFVRSIFSETKSKNFDLIIRSKTTLPSNIQNDIKFIFDEALSITGIKGGMSFQVVREFPIHPTEEIIRQQQNAQTSDSNISDIIV